jgi:photosystem II stability/assembly factor-like uncharacterized protein
LWVYDIIPSPRDSADVYVIGLDGTFHTRDGGAHWAAVHGPWERVKTDDPTAADVGSVAFDPLQPGHIYVGAGDGEYISRDDGVSWVQSRGLTEGGSSPIFSATHPGLAYLTASSGVYRTGDGGQSWQRWDGGDLRPDDEVNVLGGYVQ